MFAELFGKSAGMCGGRGGSMHIADPAVGMLGANGIVGAGLPIAVGAAFAASLRGNDSATIAFFGDGAVATGAFHEAVNLAALWKLPIIFLCENNGYAEFSTTASQHPVPNVARAAGYGIEGAEVDGPDVVAVASLVGEFTNRLRRGRGPFLVEAHSKRWHGHYEGDPLTYRPEGALEEYQDLDPIERARQRLLDQGVDESRVILVATEVETQLESALTEARSAEPVDPTRLFDFVYSPRPAAAPHTDGPEPLDNVEPEGNEWKMFEALKDALEHELEDDEDVFVAGIDAGKGGNVFALTRGLYDRWPDRLRDTPISETAILGLGVGASIVGLKPVVEIMYLDFIGVCLDQLMNQAAKIRYMTGGAVSVPLTVRTQFGSGRSSGSQHSQSLEVLLAHIPGLTVVMPSTPSDAYGLLRSAIQDPNPVIVIDNRALYGMRGPRCARGHTVPIGSAVVRRSGRDLTIVSYSRMVHDCLRAADTLALQGVDVEVIDLRTISPLDWPTVLTSIKKTGRLLVAHEAVTDFGVGAEIAARAARDGFWSLDVPIRRVGAPYAPAPYAQSLEAEWAVSVDQIVGEASAMAAE
jgi:2-oxoisovalerate dehydrogenase E1 component